MRGGTATHEGGNQLDQLWTRNIRVTNAVVAYPIADVSDHCLIQVRMEAVLTRRVQLASPEQEEIDHRSLPQTTVRKVIKKCLKDVTFDTTPYIDSRPLIDSVPLEVIRQHKPATKKGRQTVRYSPA